MRIKHCRNCKEKKLEDLFSLGKLCYSGFFPQREDINVKKKKISLIKCSSCNLVQLGQNFNPKKLYSQNYGYRSGINLTMRKHLKKIVESIKKIVNLKKNDFVLDIASNDGTLLKYYPKSVKKVGCDPILNKFKKFYSSINYKISDFFSQKKIIDIVGDKKKFKIITAIAVFYDLKNPNKFLKDIYNLLSDDGVFVLEMADLYKILKNTMFDTICHEHLEYYSCDVIINMASKNDLRVFDIEYNSSNGGSARFYICRNNSSYKTKKRKIFKILINEKKAGLKKKKTYLNFFEKINKNKVELIKLLKKLKKEKKTIFGYGASTKGNILLEYFGITRKFLDYIAERNPEKFGKFTPGDKIPIISEEKAYNLKPDYYLVLPWHFKHEILVRERDNIKKGAKFIFPLPKLKIY